MQGDRVSVRILAGRLSGPTTFQFGITPITPAMSSMVGSSSSDGIKGREVVRSRNKKHTLRHRYAYEYSYKS